MARTTIALLSMDAEVPEVETTNIAEVLEASPDSELAEVGELAAEMEDIEAAIDGGLETADTLEQSADKVEESIEDGGLPPVAAEAMNLMLSHIQRDWGMPNAKAGFALENFGSKQTRIAATKVAMEEMRKTAGNLVAGAKKTFEKIVEWVKKFFAKLFDGAVRLEETAKKVAAQAKASDKETTGKIKVAKELLPKNEKSIESGKLIGIVSKYASVSLDGTAEGFKAVVKAAGDVTDFEAFIATSRDVYEKQVNPFVDTVKIVVSDEGKASVERFTAEENGEQDALSKADVIKLAESVAKAAASLGKAKSIVAELAKTTQAAAKEVEKMTQDEAKKQLATKVMSFYTSGISASGTYNSYALAYLRAALGLCTASLSNKEDDKK